MERSETRSSSSRRTPPLDENERVRTFSRITSIPNDDTPETKSRLAARLSVSSRFGTDQ